LDLKGKRKQGRVKLHNKELNDQYCSPNIVRVIKLRIINWAGHLARKGKTRHVYRFWWLFLRETNWKLKIM